MQPQRCCRRYRSRVLGIVYKTEHLFGEKRASQELAKFRLPGARLQTPRPPALRHRIIRFYSSRKDFMALPEHGMNPSLTWSRGHRDCFAKRLTFTTNVSLVVLALVKPLTEKTQTDIHRFTRLDLPWAIICGSLVLRFQQCFIHKNQFCNIKKGRDYNFEVSLKLLEILINIIHI